MSYVWHWHVGDVRITRVQELEAPGMRFIIPQATMANLAGIPWFPPFLAPNGDAVGSVHALLLEVADRCLIVDTCIGHDKERRIPSWNKRQGPFLAHLAEAGYPPEGIDTVICTHVHKAELDKHGKTYAFVMYRNAGHAFFADYRPSYRARTAQDMWHRVLMFYDTYLQA
jgi:Dienelactone hydrolase family